MIVYYLEYIKVYGPHNDKIVKIPGANFGIYQKTIQGLAFRYLCDDILKDYKVSVSMIQVWIRMWLRHIQAFGANKACTS